MKRLLTAVSPILLGGVAFAETPGGTPITIDTTSAQNIVNGVKNWVDTVTPLVLIVVGSFLAFWAVKFVIGLVKSIGNKSK